MVRIIHGVHSVLTTFAQNLILVFNTSTSTERVPGTSTGTFTMRHETM